MPPVPEGAERLPPQSEEAERSVLGSMLRDNAVISDVVSILPRAELFYSDAHQKIFQAIVSIYDKGHPVDVILLADELKQRGQIEDIGNYGYLGVLWDAAPTAANAEYYARIVRDRALVRNLIHVSTEILRDAYDNVQPAEELLNTAERKVFEVAQMGVTGQTFTLEQAIDVAFDRIDKRHSGEHVDLSGLPTGYTDLDEITAGLQNSEMIIIAARPSVGKTSFALNIIRNIVVEGKQASFFVSLEQSRIELAERLLCCQARVDSHRLRKGTLSAEDMQKLIEAGGVLNKAKLFIDDTPGQSMLRISANARRLKMRQGIKLVVIDYLQLIEPENRRDPRQEQVAQISRRLKALARELEIPVVALAQVNRSSEDRQDHRPRLADLRESGCLAGETLITLADTGERVPIRDLAGKSGFRVWALDEVSMKLKPAEVTNAFATGHKPVFRLETGLGRVIRATANHKFRTFTGWRRLDELKIGDRIAMPRVIPCGDESGLAGNQSPSRLSSAFGVPRLCQPCGHSASSWVVRTADTAVAHGLAAQTERGYTAVAMEEIPIAQTARDVSWDAIVSIVPAGEADVFDLTVPGPHNFVGGSFIVHNSIEQDADTVMLLHRPDRYEPGQHDGVIEVIIGKQRNGPTGEVTLTYLKQYMRYDNHALGTPFEG